MERARAAEDAGGRRLHVLYVHQYFATPKGRTGTRSYEFARRWVLAGHRVTMLTSTAQLTDDELKDAAGGPFARRFSVDGIEVVAVNVAYRQSMGMIRRLWSFACFMLSACWVAVTMGGVDVVYASSTPLTVAVPALAARLRGKRYVFEVRDPWPELPVALGVLRNKAAIWLARRLERAAYRWASSMVALSPGMAELVRRVAPEGARVVVVPNGADLESFRPEIDGAAMRERFGWGDRVVCLHAGAMGRVNGLDVVVRAAERFRDDQRMLFVLMGDGRERTNLEAMRDRLGLGNLQIVDAVAKKEMPDVLAAADVGLMTVTPCPALEHNSANKFFDYLSAGLPVVLNYGGWQRETLESAGAGLGCAMGDDDAFFDNVRTLCADGALRSRMGTAARRQAEARFGRDALAAEALSEVLQAAGVR